MRGILLDWLIQVHVHFRLLPERFDIINRLLSSPVVSLRVAKLQPVGITCPFVSSKVEEIVAPFVCHFLHCADSSYTESDILLAERYALKIRLELVIPTPNAIPSSYQQGRRLRCQSSNHRQVSLGGRYTRMACIGRPSVMAAASIWLARLILGNYKWVGTSPHPHRMF
jgi:hypothetical protein